MAAKVKTIKATSRVSVKIKDSFYTVEYGEERTVTPSADLEAERRELWDTVHDEVDEQVKAIVSTFS